MDFTHVPPLAWTRLYSWMQHRSSCLHLVIRLISSPLPHPNFSLFFFLVFSPLFLAFVSFACLCVSVLSTPMRTDKTRRWVMQRTLSINFRLTPTLSGIVAPFHIRDWFSPQFLSQVGICLCFCINIYFFINCFVVLEVVTSWSLQLDSNSISRICLVSW